MKKALAGVIGIAVATAAGAVVYNTLVADAAQQQAPASVPTSTAPARPATPPPTTTQPPAAGHPGQAAVLGAPPIEFRPPMVDFGELRPHQTVTATVYIHNVSDKWLKIANAKADCSCTSTTLSDSAIAPGQAVTLNAEYAAGSVLGEKKGQIRVWIDGYDMTFVPVRSFLTMPVRAEPAYIGALVTKGGEVPVQGEYSVISNDRKPFRILAVNSEPPVFVGFDPAKDQPRNTYQLKWDFTRYNPATCRDEDGNKVPVWMIVETDHPECPVFDLEVRHECTKRPVNPSDAWVVKEKRILLGPMKAGEPSEFQVVAAWKGGAPKLDPVKTVVSESDQFKVELVKAEPVEEGVKCIIRVTPTPGHKGLVFGNLRLRSNNQNSALAVIGAIR